MARIALDLRVVRAARGLDDKAGGDGDEEKDDDIADKKETAAAMVRIVDRIDEAIPAVRIELTAMERESEEEPLRGPERELLELVASSIADIESVSPDSERRTQAELAAAAMADDANDASDDPNTPSDGVEDSRVAQLPADALTGAIFACDFEPLVEEKGESSAQRTIRNGKNAAHAKNAADAYGMAMLCIRRKVRHATHFSLKAHAKRQRKAKAERSSSEGEAEHHPDSSVIIALTLVEARHANPQRLVKALKTAIEFVQHAQYKLDLDCVEFLYCRAATPPFVKSRREWIQPDAASAAESELTPHFKSVLRASLGALDLTVERGVQAHALITSGKWRNVVTIVKELGVPWSALPAITASSIVAILNGMLSGLETRFEAGFVGVVATALLSRSSRESGSGRRREGEMRELVKCVHAVFVIKTLCPLLQGIQKSLDAMGTDAVSEALVALSLEKVLTMDLDVLESAKENIVSLFSAIEQQGGDGEQASAVHKILTLPSELLGSFVAVLFTGIELSSQSVVLFCLTLIALPVQKWLRARVWRFANWLHRRVFPKEKYSGETEYSIRGVIDDIMHVRSSAQEKYVMKKLTKQRRRDKRRTMRTGVSRSFVMPISLAIDNAVYLTTLLFGGWTIIRGGFGGGKAAIGASIGMTAQQLLTFSRTSSVMVRRLTRLRTKIDELQSGDIAELKTADQIVALFDHRPTIGLEDERYQLPEETIAHGFDNSIEFENVNFGYPGKGFTLRNVSFHVPAGSFVGICGKSGAGKTTLFKLVQRLYDPAVSVIVVLFTVYFVTHSSPHAPICLSSFSHPCIHLDFQSGRILVGGHDIKTIQPLWLRKQMSVALQVPAIFFGKLRSNLVWGAEERLELLAMENASDGAKAQEVEEGLICEAVRMVGREKHFLHSPDKYNSGIDSWVFGKLLCHQSGSYTSTLSHFPPPVHPLFSLLSPDDWMSPGEVKSVGLVRAILRDAPIFMLDEPTAGLDAETEGVVRRELLEKRKEGRTVLCVAHRLSTIRSADFILFFNARGELAEKGTWEELSEMDGDFAAFVREQSLAPRSEDGDDEMGEIDDIDEAALMEEYSDLFGATDDDGGGEEAAASGDSATAAAAASASPASPGGAGGNSEVNVPLDVNLGGLLTPTLRRSVSFVSERADEMIVDSSPSAAGRDVSHVDATLGGTGVSEEAVTNLTMNMMPLPVPLHRSVSQIVDVARTTPRGEHQLRRHISTGSISGLGLRSSSAPGADGASASDQDDVERWRRVTGTKSGKSAEHLGPLLAWQLERVRQLTCERLEEGKSGRASSSDRDEDEVFLRLLRSTAERYERSMQGRASRD